MKKLITDIFLALLLTVGVVGTFYILHQLYTV
jgi:hypothetical protein